MGLSYSLDVESLQNMNKLSEVLINYGVNQVFDTTFNGARFKNASGDWDIYPTGEYVIRKGMYINGYFVYVGSYKAYCLDLFGTGNHGYAWDGFIMTLKGYNFNQSPTVIIYDANLNTYFPGLGFGFLPMRMMYEVNCGVIGDANDIADDSSVGLYGLDIYKSIEDYAVIDADRDIKIITCGFQRINPSAESVPTGSDYIGNLYLGRLLAFNSIGNNEINYNAQIFDFSPSDDFMQVTWRANQVNHVDKTFAGNRFSLIMDLDEAIGVIEEVSQAGGVIWSYGGWFAGNSPSTQKLAKTVKVFPRKFTDITCVSQQPYNTLQQADSVWILTGDSSLDVNNDGTIDKTVPHTIACAFPYDDFITGIRATQPPFMNLNPSGATSLSDVTTYRWQLEDTTPSYNLDGSVSVFSSQPYEALDLTPPYVIAGYPETMIALNNVSYDGNTYGSIYSVLGSLLQPSFVMMPYAVQGGSFTTATGIDLPSQWYGKAVQFRTFAVAEENIAKQGTFVIDTGEFTPTSNSIYDYDTGEYIGWVSNYQRYGAFNLENPSAEPSVTTGQLTGSGYGFLGFKTGTGSIAIMFDSGSPYYNNSIIPPTHTIVVRDEGSNLSANVIDTPSSVSRKVINCGWDN
ncbi:hypothetical protein, partial [Limnobacter sp.]|uniref:hypothetical protein n=1 Tax=Limnobacter sp. TaxID=2003368 RepID=UPI00311D5A14